MDIWPELNVWIKTNLLELIVWAGIQYISWNTSTAIGWVWKVYTIKEVIMARDPTPEFYLNTSKINTKKFEVGV